MEFGKMVLANVVGRIVTSLLGIAVLLGLALAFGLTGSNDDTTERLNKGGVASAPESTASTTRPVPTVTTPDQDEQRTTLIGKMRSEGLFTALTDDQVWAKAQK